VARGALIWKAALERLPDRLHRTASNFQFPAGPKDERSLASFLLLPRNQEELFKALFIPICFGIRWLAPGVPRPSPTMIWHFLGFFFVFEFIMYQGRYLLNDVRDRKDDRKEGAQKQRFPRSWVAKDPDEKSEGQKVGASKDKEYEESRSKENQALTAAFTSFIVRWVLAALIVGCLLPIEYLTNRGWVWHAGFLVIIFVIAALYEAARNLCKTWAVAASKESRAWRTKQVCTLAVILLVGLGYGLRAAVGVGLWLAGADYTTLDRMAIGASLFGSMFVALTWALESTKANREELTKTKAHLLWFRDAVDRAACRANKTIARDENALTGWQSPLAPWAFFAVLATGALACFTFQLFPGYHPGPMALISTAILVVAVFFPLPITFLMTMLGFAGLCVFFVRRQCLSEAPLQP
jgi:hypothetical protein